MTKWQYWDLNQLPIEAWEEMHYLSLVTPQNSWPYSYSSDLAFRFFFFTYLRSRIFFIFSITYWTKMSTASVKYEKLSLGTNCHSRMVKKIIWNSLWNPCVAYLTIEGYFPNTTELKLLSHLLRFSRASSGHQALKRVRFLCLIPLLDLAYSHLCLIFFPS